MIWPRKDTPSNYFSNMQLKSWHPRLKELSSTLRFQAFGSHSSVMAVGEISELEFWDVLIRNKQGVLRNAFFSFKPSATLVSFWFWESFISWKPSLIHLFASHLWGWDLNHIFNICYSCLNQQWGGSREKGLDMGQLKMSHSHRNHGCSHSTRNAFQQLWAGILGKKRAFNSSMVPRFLWAEQQ